MLAIAMSHLTVLLPYSIQTYSKSHIPVPTQYCRTVRLFRFHDVMMKFKVMFIFVLRSSVLSFFFLFFCVVHVYSLFLCEYFFCYFCIPERRLYFNSVRMFVQVLTKIRATYLFIRDLPIGIHTALCSATDQFAP